MGPRAVANSPIPCVACEAVRGAVLHVWGSTLCPSRWTQEYFGYVMANYYTSYKGEYVCVDSNMEKGDGSTNQNQDRWYLTETYCGSLKCPPYVVYREAVCAVCSPPIGESGSVYVHWGKKTCPASATLLYPGQAASEHYNTHGSGGNALCMTDSPNWSGISTSDGNQNGARLYGARYSGSSSSLPNFFKRVGGKSVPCSLCYVQEKEAHIVAPGSDVCPKGWTLEYKGYIFAGYYSHKRSDWVCIDQDAEEGHSGSTSAYWYPTEVRCGSIPCSTNTQNAYISEREVTCAVCTPETKRRSSVYVRWGRTTCPAGATQVYAGLTAGAYHSHSGSGLTSLCLRTNATYNERSDSNEYGALLYGFEYDINGLTSNDYRSVHNAEVS